MKKEEVVRGEEVLGRRRSTWKRLGTQESLVLSGLLALTKWQGEVGEMLELPGA